MKRILPLLFVWLFTCPAWATFTLVQHTFNNACATGTTCTVTVSSTGTGNVLIGAFTYQGSGKSLTSVTGGGTWSHCANCVGAGAANSSDIYYTLASVSGATSIVFNYTSTSSTLAVCEVFEYSFSAKAVALDTSNNIVNAINTNRGGVDLTALRGANDLLVQSISLSLSSDTVTAISPAAYSVTDFVAHGVAESGFAAAANTTVGTAPTWTFTSNSNSAGSGIAITEVFNSTIGGNSSTAGTSILE